MPGSSRSDSRTWPQQARLGHQDLGVNGFGKQRERATQTPPAMRGRNHADPGIERCGVPGSAGMSLAGATPSPQPSTCRAATARSGDGVASDSCGTAAINHTRPMIVTTVKAAETRSAADWGKLERDIASAPHRASNCRSFRPYRLPLGLPKRFAGNGEHSGGSCAVRHETGALLFAEYSRSYQATMGSPPRK